MIKTANIGTIEFDKLEIDDIGIDFKHKYRKGEVFSLAEYKRELGQKGNEKAICKISHDPTFFQRL